MCTATGSWQVSASADRHLVDPTPLANGMINHGRKSRLRLVVDRSSDRLPPVTSFKAETLLPAAEEILRDLESERCQGTLISPVDRHKKT